MKVLIDDGLSTINKLTGIGYQAINLYLSLKKIIFCDITDFNYLRNLHRYLRRFIYFFHSNYLVKKNIYDIIHYQNYYVPFLKGRAKQIVTIHDLGAFKFPETIPYLYVKYNQHSILNALKRANGIIVPSSSIKEEISQFFSKVSPEKVFVCNNGIREVFWKSTITSKFLESHNVKPYSYFFFIGSLSRRKNLKFILEAFIKTKQNHIINKDTQLILAGQFWWGSLDFKHLLREDLGIKTFGYLDDDAIVELYKYSKALIFPSLYEGFGMPIIEAMSQNIPIIISNIPTSRELNKKHNNQMLEFEIDNQESFINQLKKVDKDYDIIKQRLDYGDLSIYHFNKIAEEHLRIYKYVLNSDF
ncbi:glycosyltransferase [Melioribacteraceae bacterium 4301-Me]|uniref:glycosyltransferase n=1 Tax=Pyranulibacter aquaticus TaxID=3163344 RepID=UPI003594E771